MQPSGHEVPTWPPTPERSGMGGRAAPNEGADNQANDHCIGCQARNPRIAGVTTAATAAQARPASTRRPAPESLRGRIFLADGGAWSGAVPEARCHRPLATGHWPLVPGTWHLAPGTWHSGTCTWPPGQAGGDHRALRGIWLGSAYHARRAYLHHAANARSRQPMPIPSPSPAATLPTTLGRSEERRVGKEG